MFLKLKLERSIAVEAMRILAETTKQLEDSHDACLYVYDHIIALRTSFEEKNYPSFRRMTVDLSIYNMHLIASGHVNNTS